MEITMTNTSRHLDLDAALGEHEPLTVTFKGKDYVLPGSMPSAVVIKYLPSLTASGGVPISLIEPMLRDLMGEENMTALMEEQLPYEALEKLITWMLQEYGVMPKEEGEDPNPQG